MRQSNVAAFVALGVLGLLSGSCRSPEPPDGAPVSVSAPASVTRTNPASHEPRGGADGGVPVAPVAERGPAARGAASAPRREREMEAVFGDCANGFTAGDEPRVDVVRLALLCGPSSGLAELAGTRGVVDESKDPVRFEWEAERGDCFRVFAVAADPVTDLEVDIRGPDEPRPSLENQSERWVVAPGDDVLCARRAGTFVARFGTHGGRGAFAASIWRGRGLGPGRRPADSR